jgi:outer membrane lipoprotein-sorting protein
MQKILFLFLLLALAIPAAAKIKTGEELIAAMQKKYAGKWYKTLTFVQKNTSYKPDGTIENSVWYEAMNAPGKLRIDFAPLERGDGAIYMDGMQHSFKDGKLANSRPLVHSLLVLGFDVYLQPVEKTVGQLKNLGFDLSTLREDKWEGNDVYVVGAKQGDLKSPQFWIDKKDLLFVKMIQPVGKNKDHSQEVQFNKYQKVKGGGWVSPEVVFLTDGKKVFVEEYTDVQTNVPLDAKLFDTKEWMTADRKYFEKK